MISLPMLALVAAIAGIVFGVINNEYRSSTFWFWLALLIAVVFGSVRL